MSAEQEDSEPEVLYKQFKIVVLGEAAAGKTSLAVRFAEDSFSQTYKQTIGLDFFVKRLEFPGEVHVCLQVWDIGGQALSSKMLKNYLRGAHAVLFCYDITEPSSFSSLPGWFSVVKETAAEKTKPLPLCVLMGLKGDLEHVRKVSSDAHAQFVSMLKGEVSAQTDGDGKRGEGEGEAPGPVDFSAVSAKTGENVSVAFQTIGALLAGVKLEDESAAAGGGGASGLVGGGGPLRPKDQEEDNSKMKQEIQTDREKLDSFVKTVEALTGLREDLRTNGMMPSALPRLHAPGPRSDLPASLHHLVFPGPPAPSHSMHQTQQKHQQQSMPPRILQLPSHSRASSSSSGSLPTQMMHQQHQQQQQQQKEPRVLSMQV
uniref:Uncharacterized protein n=1 Tax=Chromera velia CCMP2878 TaxID=1169474 RepID=A0A0G4HP12_9ALVE|eukprot:Cvel_7756.t1-p1 / transcript=Cvel_7756.t1 / gene=Cvel_7756 / organism=Chromera_velia_CCMP2878 / gene_product=Ras-related protein Rab-28, putative / transcript_product=Ras-related protein Rab-28, putative / location=Cvel_scaffold413:20576-31489(-) / protein_length=372 / sequence_SO=supercontig / SO=protein_coding / is_pseudo=false